jgi:hypothetical protein
MLMSSLTVLMHNPLRASTTTSKIREDLTGTKWRYWSIFLQDSSGFPINTLFICSNLPNFVNLEGYVEGYRTIGWWKYLEWTPLSA